MVGKDIVNRGAHDGRQRSDGIGGNRTGARRTELDRGIAGGRYRLQVQADPGRVVDPLIQHP